MNDGTWHETDSNEINKETLPDEFPEVEIEQPYDSGNEKDLTCGDCGERSDSVQWAILVRRKYRSSFGKLHKPYCTNCVIGELEGVHTGGGLTDRVIQKIYRIRNVPAFAHEEEQERKKHKESKKEVNRRYKEVQEELKKKQRKTKRR